MYYKWAWAEVTNHQTNLYHVLRESIAQDLNGQWRIPHKETITNSQNLKTQAFLYTKSMVNRQPWKTLDYSGFLLCSENMEKVLKILQKSLQRSHKELYNSDGVPPTEEGSVLCFFPQAQGELFHSP